MKLRSVFAASTAIVLMPPAALMAQTVAVGGQADANAANPDVVGAAVVPPGSAQLAPVQAAQSESQEIVVTARQREERLQDVPIAVRHFRAISSNRSS